MNKECVHIIHLSHRTDRWLLLQNELLIQQISNTKLWDGVIDETLPSRGISLAHKQIIRWAKQNGLKEICIAEDDVQFSAPGAFNYFINRKPANFDIYLGGITWGSIRENYTVRDFSGTMLYIACEKFYDVILSLPEDKDYDRAMAGLGKFVICDPMIAWQHNGYSDNQRRYIDFGPLLQKMKRFRQ